MSVDHSIVLLGRKLVFHWKESYAPAESLAPSNGSGDAPHKTEIPQELIEEVVRRTMDRISDDVIREVAWEVVPDLAEQLIRKRLAENR